VHTSQLIMHTSLLMTGIPRRVCWVQHLYSLRHRLLLTVDRQGLLLLVRNAAPDGGEEVPVQRAVPPGRLLPTRAQVRCLRRVVLRHCRLIQGDGEDVSALVERLRPRCLFLDFDRTVCSTKAGGSPLSGTHSVDPELLALLCAPLSTGMDVHIVTRNSHKEDIESFLVIKGVRCTHLSGSEGVDEVEALTAKLELGGAGALVPPRCRTKVTSCWDAKAKASRAGARPWLGCSRPVQQEYLLMMMCGNT
jgi:hypothetical protein